MPGFLGMPGVTRLVADNASIGTAGMPIRVYDVTSISDAVGASIIYLRNGTADTDVIEIQLDTAAASKCKTWTSPCGILFPNGCYADVDGGNSAFVTISWCSEL